MNNPYALGFIKRAQEYGLNQYQAVELAKQALSIDDLAGYGNQALDKIKEYGGKAQDAFRNSALNDQLLKAKDYVQSHSMGDMVNDFRNSPLNDKLLQARHFIEGNRDAQGALAGAALGGLGGAMTGGEDEEGETHRLRNALLGMTGGALAGAGGTHLYNDPRMQQAVQNMIKKYKNSRVPQAADGPND
jgi:hypothetical protein